MKIIGIEAFHLCIRKLYAVGILFLFVSIVSVYILAKKRDICLHYVIIDMRDDINFLQALEESYNISNKLLDDMNDGKEVGFPFFSSSRLYAVGSCEYMKNFLGTLHESYEYEDTASDVYEQRYISILEADTLELQDYKNKR